MKALWIRVEAHDVDSRQVEELAHAFDAGRSRLVVRVRAHAIDSIELGRLADERGWSKIRTLGLISSYDHSVREWIAANPKIARVETGYWRPRRKDVPRRIRLAVYERDGFRCVYCGSASWLTLDHVEFHSRGGADTIENLRTACLRCNSKRQPPRALS